MRRFLLVIAVLCLAGPVQAANDFAPVPVLAILYFDDATGVDQLKWLPKGFADLLIRDFENVGTFRIVPRDKVEEAVNLYPADTKDKYKPQKYVRIGKILGATHVIGGRFTLQDTTIIVEVKVYSTKNAKLSGWRQVEGPADDLLYIQKQVGLKILELMGMHLSDRELIAMLQIPTDSVKAFAYYSMGIDANDHGDRDLARQYFQTALEADKYFRPAVAAISRMAFVISGKAVLRASVEETRPVGVSGVNSVSDLIELARTNAFEFNIGEPIVSPIADDTARVNVKVPFQVSVRQDFVNFWLYSIRRLSASSGEEPALQWTLTRSDLFDKPFSMSLPASLAESWLAAWKHLSMRLQFQNSAGAVLFESPSQPVLPVYIANTEGQLEPGVVTFWKMDTAFEIERVPKPFFEEPLEVSLEIDR